ncbi:acyl carrier protein [Bacillus thuringiensis]|uniref:acyl carrier protein n=1 Tax=Bacillus thuringiensis TaxID=1428 RepID=UPI000BEBA785|nr:phosphopantetheine-binding protein [Bacillus thuringiensis]PEC17501.1 acyl carrier protein [Bacillus thuringiensis]PEV14641.1 acyl carrier protein [Bacillus thuringiensis]PEY72817.1 acyl carrier protein [Bacillus thuringiensis]PFC45703.1 acyl carrier protein [Bacillus thuringiensis]PGV69485.1 acyl carrier protein [Bacillus thuringiensis]
MKSISNINDTIQKFVVEIEPRNQLPLELNSNFIDDLWFDSLSFIALIVSIETEYDIEINPENLVLDEIKTIEDLSILIFNTLKEKE